MKLLTLCLFLSTFLLAESRPKIALVLSGGGARGGAHVGVLKALEEQRIPIDMIVGTSMGSFVGGLYASGQSPQEIEQMLVSSDWKKYIRTGYDRQDVPIRRKSMDYTYQGLLGLGVNVNNSIVLPTGVLKRQPLLFKFLDAVGSAERVGDFDKLNIPYRAVATNIQNGEAVVLDSGSLAKAIYASSSIPGGLQPINIDGKELVDGGVSQNIPVEVAREMGAEIIIAVDVSENFEDDLNVDSYFVVMGQLVDILMRKNANESIESLRKNDILITPELEGYSGLDADKYAEIIAKGYEVSDDAMQKLKALSLSKEEYALYKSKQKKSLESFIPIVDEIKIINPTYLADDSLRKRISQRVGQPFDERGLRKDLMHIYHMTIFDSVEYSLVPNEGKNVLIIQTQPSWDNHGEIRFALGLEDDFLGHSAYSIKLGYSMYGINSYGAEWRSDFEIGRRKKAYTEFFQPLDTMQRFYVRPSLTYESILDIFLADEFGNQEIYSQRRGGAFAAGVHLGVDYEFEVGMGLYEDKVEVDFFSIIGLPGEFQYNARPIYANLNIDSLDNVNFPTKGLKAQLGWAKDAKEFGSDYDYEQVYVEIEKPLNLYTSNFVAYAKYVDTYRDDKIFRLSGMSTLGGLFNLSGYRPYSFYDTNMFLGVLKYTYEIKDGGFFNTLNAPLYAGFSAEVGSTWGRYNSLSYENVKQSGSIYLAADTFLGPFYFAYGFSAEGEESFYLYLGEKF